MPHQRRTRSPSGSERPTVELGGRIARTAAQRRQSEIEQLDALLGHQDIRGLQVAMRDAFLVRSIQGFQDLLRVFGGFCRRKGTLDRSAFHQLHHQVIRSHVVKLADVWMIQRRDCSSFALEPFIELALGELECDGAAQPAVARARQIARGPRNVGGA